MSGSGFFEVDHTVVKSHAGSLQDALGKFTSNSSEFDAAMTELLGKIKGGAKTELANLQHQWSSAAGQVNKALEQLGVRTEDVASTYVSAQDEQATNVRSAGGRMDFHTAESTNI
uniref:WXG100 family type VII secretion target n=1 Tax=Gordonia sp. B7-2 TaxID=3420932 RepID=UPI003D8BE061